MINDRYPFYSLKVLRSSKQLFNVSWRKVWHGSSWVFGRTSSPPSPREDQEDQTELPTSLLCLSLRHQMFHEKYYFKSSSITMEFCNKIKEINQDLPKGNDSGIHMYVIDYIFRNIPQPPFVENSKSFLILLHESEIGIFLQQKEKPIQTI
jgi:hypothetical protein